MIPEDRARAALSEGVARTRRRSKQSEQRDQHQRSGRIVIVPPDHLRVLLHLPPPAGALVSADALGPSFGLDALLPGRLALRPPRPLSASPSGSCSPRRRRSASTAAAPPPPRTPGRRPHVAAARAPRTASATFEVQQRHSYNNATPSARAWLAESGPGGGSAREASRPRKREPWRALAREATDDAASATPIASLLPAVVGEGLVRLRHAVDVVLALVRETGLLGRASISSPASRSDIDFSRRLRANSTSQRTASVRARGRAPRPGPGRSHRRRGGSGPRGPA